jgi:hypothetical protein
MGPTPSLQEVHSTALDRKDEFFFDGFFSIVWAMYCNLGWTYLVWVRTDLSSSLKVVEMHTWSSGWKRVIIIYLVEQQILAHLG